MYLMSSHFRYRRIALLVVLVLGSWAQTPLLEYDRREPLEYARQQPPGKPTNVVVSAPAPSCLTTWTQPSFDSGALAHLVGMPDFGASPTRTASQDGNWSDTATWGGSSVPGAGAIVNIPHARTVTYDVNSATALKAVGINGRLNFSKSTTTRMVVSEVLVYNDGFLDIGDCVSPMPSGITATLEFDGTLDTGTVSPGPIGSDPAQFGVGLIVLGRVRMHGQTKTPFVRLSAEVAANAASVTLASTPTNWLSGDEIVLPESKPRSHQNTTAQALQGSLVPWDDRETLSGNVSSTTANFSGTTTWAHPCAKLDGGAGACDIYPHAVNTTRNVIIKSANPAGVRGHTMFTYRADADIRYTLFDDLGRTTTADLSCLQRTTGAVQGVADCIEGTGTITAIGTNQEGRYAAHFHHLWGPTNASNTGYQAKFIGNAIRDATKWPIALHLSSYVQVEDNVLAYFEGPGIFLEEFSEHYNSIRRNFCTGAASIKPARGADDAQAGLTSNAVGAGGREPACVWAHGGTNNYVTDNVAAGFWGKGGDIIMEVGYKFHFHGATLTENTKVPNFRGADLTDTDEYTLTNMRALPLLEFARNECYNVNTCMTVWNHGAGGGSSVEVSSMPVSYVDDLTAWHIPTYGWFSYPIKNYTFRRMKCRGEHSANGMGANVGNTPSNDTHVMSPNCWIGGDYKSINVVLENMDSQGMYASENASLNIDSTFTINGLTSRDVVGIVISGVYVPGTNFGPTYSPLTIAISDYNWTAPSGSFSPEKAIWMNYDPYDASAESQFHGDTLDSTPVTLDNYNGNGLHYDLYYSEQIGSSVAGGLAPCSDTTTYTYITGVVCNVSAPAPEPLVLWNNLLKFLKGKPNAAH